MHLKISLLGDLWIQGLYVSEPSTRVCLYMCVCEKTICLK